MKAISVQQPYAEFIANGEKPIENRTYQINYRGPIAIHASKTSRYLSNEELANMTTGAIVAVAKIVACIPVEEIHSNSEQRPNEYPEGCIEKTWAQLAASLHCEGPLCIILEEVRRVTPLPASGQLGVWYAGPLRVMENEDGSPSLVRDESTAPPKPAGAE